MRQHLVVVGKIKRKHWKNQYLNNWKVSRKCILWKLCWKYVLWSRLYSRKQMPIIIKKTLWFSFNFLLWWTTSRNGPRHTDFLYLRNIESLVLKCTAFCKELKSFIRIHEVFQILITIQVIFFQFVMKFLKQIMKN